MAHPGPDASSLVNGLTSVFGPEIAFTSSYCFVPHRHRGRSLRHLGGDRDTVGVSFLNLRSNRPHALVALKSRSVTRNPNQVGSLFDPLEPA